MARREVTGRKPGVTAGLIERNSGSPKLDDDEPDDDEADGDEPDNDEADDDEADDDEPNRQDEPAPQAAATRPPIRGPPRRLAPRTDKARRKAATPVGEADAFTIDEFCQRHRISVQVFYKYPRLMPQTFYVGKRRLISREAAARWRAEREAAGGAR